jgi:low temperature requirement protein LtrA
VIHILTSTLQDETCNVELGVCKQFTTKIHIAWYIVSAAEVVITVAISCYWRVISFKGTHIQQRMSLLTLIILGEGIIVICKAISKIVKNGSQFDGDLTGQIIAAVVIICKYLGFISTHPSLILCRSSIYAILRSHA